MSTTPEERVPSTPVERLSPAALPRLGRLGTVEIPRVVPDGVGIVHLGIGAFHRAHQAVFTEEAAAATGDEHWGICGVTQRTNTVADQLHPQGCLYTVLERGDGRSHARIVAAVREVLSARDDSATVRGRIADEAVRLVTLTVTEKGYRRRSDGRLDLTDPLVRDDIAGHPPLTVVGQLVRGLQRRMERGAPPLTVLPCDNLASGGPVLRGLVLDFCAALPDGDRLGAWISEQVSFPSAVVDRIVPATRDIDRAEVARMLAVHDEGLVVAEPFRQWVIEDAFADARPAWEHVGAILTRDVRSYETAKLRLLNGTHSLLAYTGALAGHDTIADAVQDPILREAADRFMVEDVTPTLTAPPSLDLSTYRKQVLERFANPALPHRTIQVARDGSQKLPLRLLGTIRDRLAAGAEPYWAALAVAAWMVFVVRGTDERGRPLPLDDPIAKRLYAASSGSMSPSAVVDRMLAMREVFGDDLADQPVLGALLMQHVARLL